VIAIEDESADDDGIRFDKVLFKTIGGILFLKVIHNSKKENTDIDDTDIGDKRIGPLRRVRHGKSIIYILSY
jgi:hypothetical protein